MLDNLNRVENREQRLDEAATAYLEALESGEVPDRDQYLALYPDLIEELTNFFNDRDWVERWTVPLRAARTEWSWGSVDGQTRCAKEEKTAVSVASPTAAGCFGDYELLAEIGRGGMGVVFRARQKSLQRLVALKMMRAVDLAGPADRQ